MKLVASARNELRDPLAPEPPGDRGSFATTQDCEARAAGR